MRNPYARVFDVQPLPDLGARPRRRRRPAAAAPSVAAAQQAASLKELAGMHGLGDLGELADLYGFGSIGEMAGWFSKLKRGVKSVGRKVGRVAKKGAKVGFTAAKWGSGVGLATYAIKKRKKIFRTLKTAAKWSPVGLAVRGHLWAGKKLLGGATSLVGKAFGGKTPAQINMPDGSTLRPDEAADRTGIPAPVIAEAAMNANRAGDDEDARAEAVDAVEEKYGLPDDALTPIAEATDEGGGGDDEGGGDEGGGDDAGGDDGGGDDGGGDEGDEAMQGMGHVRSLPSAIEGIDGFWGTLASPFKKVGKGIGKGAKVVGRGIGKGAKVVGKGALAVGKVGGKIALTAAQTALCAKTGICPQQGGGELVTQGPDQPRPGLNFKSPVVLGGAAAAIGGLILLTRKRGGGARART